MKTYYFGNKKYEFTRESIWENDKYVLPEDADIIYSGKKKTFILEDGNYYIVHKQKEYKNPKKGYKKLKTEINAMSELFNTNLDKINKEHNKILLQSLSNLIHDICQGENIDELYIREKYLDIEKTTKQDEKKIVVNKTDDLLDKVTVNDKKYYYQNKENGLIYNDKSKVVGNYINKKFIFN